MQLEYDLNAQALYIRLSDAKIVRTREAGDNAAVDLDADGDVVGIEVIAVGHPWPMADILSAYPIPAGEQAQIRTYFWFSAPSVQRQPLPTQPAISIASPAPAALLSPVAA